MDQPIRILQCVTIMNRNGLENRLMDIYRNIDRSVIQFDFMTNRTEDGEFDEEIKQLGGRVYHMSRIAPKPFSVTSENCVFSLCSIRNIRSFIPILIP